MTGVLVAAGLLALGAATWWGLQGRWHAVTDDAYVNADTTQVAAQVAATPVPRNVITLPELPLLGSGKTDYQTLNRMAKEQVKP